MKKYKRLISVLLALLMCVSLFPVSAFAAEEADEPAEAVETAEPAEEAILPEEAEEPEDPADEPVEEIAPQNAEEPAEDGVEVCDAATGLELTDAAGAYDFDEVDEDDENVHRYWYELYRDAGETVDLYVEVTGAPAEEISYTWYEHDQVISGETGPKLTNFTARRDTSYICSIRWGESEIRVIFEIEVEGQIEADGPTRLSLLPAFGTAHYYSLPGMPVILRFDVPEDIDPYGYEFFWYTVDEKGVPSAMPFDDGREVIVNPMVSTRYAVRGFRESPMFAGIETISTYLEFFVEIVPASRIISLEQEYLTLASGESIILNAPEFPAYWNIEDIGYEWFGENQVPSDDNEAGAVIEVKDNGDSSTVSAVGEGSAFVTLVLFDLEWEIVYLRCRIDVTEGTIADAVVTDNYQNGVTLPSASATVNVYSTDYTRFNVLVDLENNQIGAQGLFIEPDDLDNAGAAIGSARFTDETVNEVFSLRVADDRTLEIIPNIDFENWSKADIDAAVKAVKGSYKSTVTVTLQTGESLVTDKQLSLKVKKTLPKVTATAVKFNSFDVGEVVPIALSCGQGSARPDPSKTQPDWVRVNPDEMSLTFTGQKDKSYSGKLYLLVRPANCAAEVPVTVTVKAARSAPKLKVKETLTYNPNIGSELWTTVTITPIRFAGRRIQITKITEGKQTWSVADDTLYDAPIYCGVEMEDNYYFIVDPGSSLDTSKAHTFKVTLDLDGATTVATVKTLAKSAKTSLKLKTSGTIDTGIPYSFTTVTWSGRYDPEIRIMQYKGKTLIDEDVRDLFEVSTRYSGSASQIMIWEKSPNTIPEGYTYYLAGELLDNDDSVVASAKVKLPVKWSKNPARISISLKASGVIDLVRPDSAVTLTAGPIKNFYRPADNYSPPVVPVIDASNLVFSWDKDGKNIIPESDIPFIVTPVYTIVDYLNGPEGKATFSLTLEEGRRQYLNPREKFYVRVLIPAEQTGGQEVTTKPVQIKLTKSTPKITATVKSVQLLKNDRFSYANIGIAVPKGYTPIAGIYLDEKSSQRFEIMDNCSGHVELRFRNNVVSTTKATVKLYVILEGNNTGKPDAVLSVKVKVV